MRTKSVRRPKDRENQVCTPKAFPSYEPRVVATLGKEARKVANAESVRKRRDTGQRFQRLKAYRLLPQGCRKLQPWAEISKRLRRSAAWVNASGVRRAE